MFVKKDGNLDQYLTNISKNITLTKKEERDCAIAIKKNDKKALNKLIKANLRFVVSVAKNYQNQGMSLEDLINEGNLGLIRAARRFDERKDFKFISYAVWWIRQSILQGLADHSRIVKVPLNKVATIHKVRKAEAALEQKWGSFPNEYEVAEELGISYSEVKSVAGIGSRHSSLDAPLTGGEGNSGSLYDMICSDRFEESDYYSEEQSVSREVIRVLESLGSRESSVLQMYFGINLETSYTLEEIGSQLQITRERVRQIKDSSLKKLRQNRQVMSLIESTLFS